MLIGVFRYAARRAVSLNLAISLITIASALAVRSGTLSLEEVFSLFPVIAAMIVGAVSAAYVGVSLVHRISERLLERLIFALLIILGTGLIIESFLPLQSDGLLPDSLFVRLVAGVLLGLGIGLVSSLLGVAGGELIIPTLVFAFGADIRVAGTASLIISLPTVATGILRHARLGSYSDREDLTQTVAPMGAGSVVGAVAGGLLVGFAPAAFLKLLLGVILIISAVRTFRHR